MADIWNLDALCRCCHADGHFRNLQEQYVIDNTVENYLNMLLEAFGVSIKPHPGNASYSICDECIAQLRSACRFKKQVLECETKFEEYCKNELSLNFDVKTEPEYLDDNFFGSDDENNSVKDKKDENTTEYSDVIQKSLKNIKKEENKVLEIMIEVEPKVEGKPGHKRNRTSVKGKSKNKSKLVVKVKTETGDQFSCKNCGVTYENIEELNRHIDEEHIKTLKCQYCEETFKSELKYKEHNRLKHNDSKPFTCEYCGKKIASKLSLMEHINGAHTKEKFFQCDLCQKIFHNKVVLKIHLKKHYGTFRKFICEQCGVQCNDTTNLKLHVLTVHEKLRLFPCKECGKSFSAAKHLKIHVRKHTGERPYECDICLRAFMSREGLKAHQKIHTNSGYKCKTCEKTFPTRGVYASHYRSHVGSKPFKCNLCSKEFANKYSLNRHVFEHSGERPFVCPICHKDFKQKPQLVRHNARFHTEKPVVVKEKCDICKRTVPNLDKHIQAHTNKPFGCHLCDKRYPEQNALNRHLQRHSGIKPHPCDLCDKGFIQLKTLKNHKLKVHKIPLKTEQEDHYDSLVTTYTIQNLKRAFRSKLSD